MTEVDTRRSLKGFLTSLYLRFRHFRHFLWNFSKRRLADPPQDPSNLLAAHVLCIGGCICALLGKGPQEAGIMSNSNLSQGIRMPPGSPAFLSILTGFRQVLMHFSNVFGFAIRAIFPPSKEQ